MQTMKKQKLKVNTLKYSICKNTYYMKQRYVICMFSLINEKLVEDKLFYYYAKSMKNFPALAIQCQA